MNAGLHDLLAPSHRVRLRAIRELPGSDALRYALRRLVFGDPHAEVRATAARRLGDLSPRAGDGVEAWLVEALQDPSPLVRDAALRSLARVGTPASSPPIRRLVTDDRMWWVRRAAIYALAAIAGDGEVAALSEALGDPFWRVRHAAVKVLAVLGARDPAVREDVLAAPPSVVRPDTLTFLRASWGPVAIEAPDRAASTRSQLPEELLDPDPAVVTARLATANVSPVALVELLCDPHEPLRSLASARIARVRDPAALAAALDWLEEPRIPHVVETVHDLLDRLGDPAAPLAAGALARTDRPGAGRWAIGWVVATRYETLYAAACERARNGDASLKRLALRLPCEDELVLWASDAELIDAVAGELHDRHTEEARDALLQLDGAGHPRVRALQTDARAQRGEWVAVQAALADPHHGPRAIATRWLVRRGVELPRDPDPAVREAALDRTGALAAIHDEIDPYVRRAAVQLLAMLSDGDDDPAVVAATHAALVDADPWIRACVSRRPIRDDRALACTLDNLGHADDQVRSAAHDALANLDNADVKIRRVLPSLADATRRMAQLWLVRELDDAAAEHARAALDGETDVRTRVMLGAVAGIAIEAPTAERVAPVIEAARVPAQVQRRPFGRAGFDVAPLVISGAYDVPLRSLEAADEAGVDLYFWEPGYDLLAKFLRTRGEHARVVTGSYHADAASVRRDVERALRVLKRDTLDAFLLFWTRSPARVDAAAFAMLDELKREGLVRAIGFSTHFRDLARSSLETHPWDVIMIRHSAAHPGIESELLPTARETGAAILTFSALTYGRMLSGANAPSPADCYRYTLSQPGVTACISAPRRHEEVVENVRVLADPMLTPERMAALREFGTGVRAESQRFNTLLRQPTRDAAAAAREMLAAESPPADLQMPRGGSRKRSRTRLGRRRGGV